jgi:hypothetical protein
MPEKFTQEQIWKLYEKLPQELKRAVFSEETANNIWDICIRNGIEDDRISEIARLVGRVLLGLIPPDELQKILEKEIKLSPEIAKKTFQEINRLVFSSVKYSLTELYKTPAKPLKKAEEEPPPAESDVYREPVE